MKRILINATQQEELRVAMVDGQKLYDLDVDTRSREQKKGNIYKAKISRIEPSLEAAFVDYGAERHGFLPLKEISKTYFKKKDVPYDRHNIKGLLETGQELIIQIEREERGNKGAAVTTFLSLAGRYLVLMPNNPRAGGISRRVEGEERKEVIKTVNKLDKVDGGGIIVRTAGVGRSVEELKWDQNYLVDIWKSIKDVAKDKTAPFLIYRESNIITRTLRDHVKGDIGEILIDDERIYVRAKDFMELVMPQSLKKLKLYKDNVPLFSRYQIESQIESSYRREVSLPSGGVIVIDHTEALLTIDINSAKATKGGDIEATAFQTNLEAADEIARQLRVRDLGGLIVIDFIDMSSTKHQRDVEARLRSSAKTDRARLQFGQISKFGLLEISRQRLRPSLGELTQIVCPRCHGQGTIRGVESLSLSVLRLMEEEALKEKTGRIIAELPVDVATFLMNEKRQVLNDMGNRHNVDLTVVPNVNLDTPNFNIQRYRVGEKQAANKNSYEMQTEKAAEYDISTGSNQPYEQAVIESVLPSSPAPKPPSKTNGAGLLKKLLGFFSNSENKESTQTNKNRRRGNTRRPHGNYRRRHRNNKNN
ncbi:MAG: Rne/Rng family ribonuclease [Pseudomonadota bacterium]